MLHAVRADAAILANTKLTPEQEETLETCVIMEHEVLAIVAAEQKLSGQEYQEGSERELWLHRGLRPAISGHCDYWRYYPKARVLVILDRKFGRLEVQAAHDNLQLRTYAVQGAEEWDCAHVYVAIIQPRVHAPPTLAHYTAEDLEKARYQLYHIIDSYSAPQAPRMASEDACQYCKARFDCPERTAVITTATPLAQLPVQSLTTEQMTACLTAIAMLDDSWVDEIKREARARIEAGTLPGFALKENAPRRNIVSAFGAFHKLREAGFTDDDLFSVAKLTMSGATELYSRKGRKPKEIKQCLELVLGDLIQPTKVEPSVIAI